MSTPEQDCENGVERDVKEWAKLYTPVPGLEVAMHFAHIQRNRVVEMLITVEPYGLSLLEWRSYGSNASGVDYYIEPPSEGWFVYAVRERP